MTAPAFVVDSGAHFVLLYPQKELKGILVYDCFCSRAYDYFYSMQVMQNSGTNPVQNYTGGCLGYFSACNIFNYDTVFRRAEVETE